MPYQKYPPKWAAKVKFKGSVYYNGQVHETRDAADQAERDLRARLTGAPDVVNNPHKYKDEHPW